MLKAACDMGLEGIVAKRRDAPYRSGKVETWLKVKCTMTEPFAVIRFDPAGRTGVAGLKLAALREGFLAPVGAVGSRLSERDSRELRNLLEAGTAIVATVEFRGWTPAGSGGTSGRSAE